MAKTTIKRRTAYILGGALLLLGFLIGELVPIPALNNIDPAAMFRPGGASHRRSPR